MKQSVLLVLFMLLLELSYAQISRKNMWLAGADKYNTQLNIFNLKTGDFVKSIFVGEKIRYSQFNEEESKLFILTKNFLFITDLKTFETDKKALLSTLAIGITKKGNVTYYGGPFVDFDKRTITYVFQDILKSDKFVNRITEPHMGVYFNEKLYIPLLDGGLKIVDADTRESKLLENTLDTGIMNAYTAAHPDLPIELAIQSFGNQVMTNVYDGRIKSVNIYNTTNKKIEFTELDLFKFEQPEIIPVACYNSPQLYFMKSTPLQTGTVAPQRPEYPQEPDYSSINPKEVKKAEKEYHSKQMKYENELTAYEQAYNIYAAPEHNIAHIYSDVKGTKEITQIPQAKHIYIDGEYLVAEKDDTIDVIESKTGKKLWILTHPSQ